MVELSSSCEAHMQEVGAGIFQVDVLHPVPGHTCCYLIVEDGVVAVIDCGAKQGSATILSALKKIGLSVVAVKWLVLTHAHLDHAGAAGTLMQQLPQATLAAHPSTIRHIVDPEMSLIPATRHLFGNALFNEHYHGIIPVAATRTHALADGNYLTLANQRVLQALYAPGHAWNHLVIYDQAASFIAAGDAYGVSYRPLDSHGQALILPVTSPTQFDPTAMENSIRQLHRRQAKTIGLAHCGVLTDTDDLMQQQLTLLKAWRQQAEALLAEPTSNHHRWRQHLFKGFMDSVLERARCRGIDSRLVQQYNTINVDLSARGFEHWLNKQVSTKGQ